MKAVEIFYTVQSVALLLGLCEKTVIVKLKAREFGAEVVNLGSMQRPDYRIPASGVNGYLTARRVFLDMGIPARSVGELRRNAATV
jgi:hypothetical protein